MRMPRLWNPIHPPSPIVIAASRRLPLATAGVSPTASSNAIRPSTPAAPARLLIAPIASPAATTQSVSTRLTAAARGQGDRGPGTFARAVGVSQTIAGAPRDPTPDVDPGSGGLRAR